MSFSRVVQKTKGDMFVKVPTPLEAMLNVARVSVDWQDSGCDGRMCVIFSIEWVVVREVPTASHLLPPGYLQVEKAVPLQARLALQPVLSCCCPMELECVKPDAWLQSRHLLSLPVWGGQVLVELVLGSLA